MSYNLTEELDDEREVSSDMTEQLDRLLYERHFRNNPIRQTTNDNHLDTNVNIHFNYNNDYPITTSTSNHNE